jgi:predicted nucleic acid-binding protein
VSGPVAVLDACVLVPIRLATTLLWLAEADLFQPLWSEPILDEVRRNLPKVGVTPEQASRRVGMMREAFGAEALVDGFEDLIDEMTCDPKDRHVLAAAVVAGADTVVTFNLKDFPDEVAARHGIQILHPDSFLLQLLGEHADTVVAALKRETAAFRNPPETVTRFLATLTATVPMFANLAADAFSHPPGAVSAVPALVRADNEEAIAALGEPGDLTNPAQVAYIWWAGLLDDLDLAREFTYHPPAWGDYQWAINDLADRSLASKVIWAVDAPDQIAFMRFVPEVAAAAQVFESYLTMATFLTLVEVGNGTWRVWGLGPSILSAKDIFGD